MNKFKPGDQVIITTHGRYWFTDFGSRGVVVENDRGYGYTVRWIHLARYFASARTPTIGNIGEKDLGHYQQGWKLFYQSL